MSHPKIRMDIAALAIACFAAAPFGASAYQPQYVGSSVQYVVIAPPR